MQFKKIAKVIGIILVFGTILAFIFVPAVIEKGMNVVDAHDPYPISEQAQALHNSLVIGDWHADSALWMRDLAEESSYGQVDIPRMQKGNQAIQMFTVVTKAPTGLNYDENDASSADNITRLAVLQRWPISTWKSLTARAIFQAKKISELAERDTDNFKLILSKTDLANFFQARETNTTLTAGLIGTEGSHALDGNLENIQVLFDHGFRMMSLQHFFDNKLGGSLHGKSHAGLTDFGRQALEKMQALSIIIDVSHSSEKVVEDVLALNTTPLVVSHTGFKGHCDSPRNIRDDLMQSIAAKGGLIGVGYWEGAICGNHPSDIAKTIMYGIKLVGSEHVSLGSDFDGSVTTAIDSSELAAITQSLLDLGATQTEISLVMGGNMKRFLEENLPD